MKEPKFECKTSISTQVLQEAGPNPTLIGSIDQGTSSTRFLLFTQNGHIAAYSQVEHTQIFPPEHVGWHEHDPFEIWSNTCHCMANVSAALKSNSHVQKLDIDLSDLKAIGITNQRETTIVWNAQTGKPYHNALVWDDLRTTGIADTIANGDTNRLRDRTGLPLASYFAGTKVKWLIDNVQQLKNDLMDETTRDDVRFGTIDTWLVYQLTGSPPSPPISDEEKYVGNVGGLYITDVSNASRWLFMDLQTLDWDLSLVEQVCNGSDATVPLSALPQIKASSTIYGHCSPKFGVPSLSGVPISGILGDQQAALFGQGAFEPGEAKNTYGTGLFLMMNTGTQMMPSKNGLLTTVGYKIGDDGEAVYALEGSVSHSGSTIQWLRDQLQIISNAAESETLASQVSSNDGLYFVPAFAGLFAPYWKADARACIVGMTASHNRNHIARAALEACAYQTKDVFDAIYADSNVELKELRVDGGGTANKLLMQFQADTINVPVVIPVIKETTALGAAFAAGLAVGVWSDLKELKALWREEERFQATMADDERSKNWRGWKKAITKSMGWAE
jgi:glycerol kinase